MPCRADEFIQLHPVFPVSHTFHQQMESLPIHSKSHVPIIFKVNSGYKSSTSTAEPKDQMMIAASESAMFQTNSRLHTEGVIVPTSALKPNTFRRNPSIFSLKTLTLAVWSTWRSFRSFGRHSTSEMLMLMLPNVCRNILEVFDQIRLWGIALH